MKNLLVFILFVSFFNCSLKDNTITKKQKTTKYNTSKTTAQRIKSNLKTITKTTKPRNYQNVKTLNTVADFIKTELDKVCDTANYQNFLVNNDSYKNVIGSLGIKNKERIIIGAHYDVCGTSEGADDNASGVVGLLELARKLSK